MLNDVVRFFLVWIGLILPFQASALIGGPAHVKAELIQEEETIQPGQPFWVAVSLKVEDGWHVYWKNPGDAGIPLKVEWNLPAGFEAGPLQWPFPEKFTVADMVGFGYEKDVVFLSQITPPQQINSDEDLSLTAQVKWLVCSALTCQPGSASVTSPLKIAQQTPVPNANVKDFFAQARSKIPQTHVEVKTIRKHGIVQVEVPQEIAGIQDKTIQNIYFFPEDKDVIDHSIEPTVDLTKTDHNRYLVNLKGSDEIGACSKTLKGVLVLHKQEGNQESYQAFDIDSPIQNSCEQDVLSLREGNKQELALAIGNPTLDSTVSSTFEGGLGLALLFAFAGGMILNLMPCVLPVISFKVMSFVKMAGQSRALIFKHGLMFSLGVLLSFWVLASAMLLLRAYGQSVGWGFQLQEPIFVVILASLLFIFSLSLFNVFEWGLGVAAWAGQTEVETKQKSSGYVGSFCSGILATAVATPCTGPFLGSAVGFAVTLPIWQAMSIFTFLALGMCFPYLLLSAFPACLRFMPKPGAWMETFKQLMGFLLLTTVLWLAWVFSAQTNTFSLICLLAGFLCFSIGAWLYGRGSAPLVSRAKRVVAYAFVLIFFVMGCQAILLPKATWSHQEGTKQGKDQWAGWEEFSPERVAQLRNEGKPVLIDFTAKWCLICQANHLVLSSGDVEKELANAGVVKLKADWTKSDPVITQELSKFGRNSVPLYVYYGPGEQQEPKILPQVLTPDVVIDHVKTAEIALK